MERNPKKAGASVKDRLLWIICCTTIITGILGFFLASGKKDHPIVHPEQYSFTIQNPVVEGVPASVVFNYNALPSIEDEIGIQRFWPPSKPDKVPRAEHAYTGVFYYPGYYRPRLIVSEQMVKEQELLVKTKGWQGIVENDPVPVYFGEQDILKGNELALTPELLMHKNISPQSKTLWSRLANIGNWGDVKTNAFTFEAEVKNNFMDAEACRFTELRLLCNGTTLVIPLGAKSCVPNLHMNFLGSSFSGAEKDLSKFGVDFNNWVKVQVQVHDGQARVSVNGTPALQMPAPAMVFKILGVDCRFQGFGALRGVVLESLK